ncbi:MAG: hypothetical protein AMXMBFR56_66290 [Polyangiaceae bacterium]
MDEKTITRFWSHVDKGGPSISAALGPCWLWTSTRTVKGYGLIRLNVPRKMERAHRVAWELEHGAIGDGVCVLHRCDTPSCVRVSHLFLGTRGDNILDMVTKGRTTAKLAPEDVLAIRREFVSGLRGGGRVAQVGSARELARRFGVHKKTVHQIASGALRAVLPPPPKGESK